MSKCPLASRLWDVLFWNELRQVFVTSCDELIHISFQYNYTNSVTLNALGNIPQQLHALLTFISLSALTLKSTFQKVIDQCWLMPSTGEEFKILTEFNSDKFLNTPELKHFVCRMNAPWSEKYMLYDSCATRVSELFLAFDDDITKQY